MAKEVPIGIRGTAEFTVEPEHTLHHHNKALPLIFSTPHMIGLMEWAAANAMLPFCDEGEISVGTAINIEHRAPTTLGARGSMFMAVPTLISPSSPKRIIALAA